MLVFLDTHRIPNIGITALQEYGVLCAGMTLLDFKYEPKSPPSNDFGLDLTPRDWQLSALDAWKLLGSGIASVATGSGKTIFAFLCMKSAFQVVSDLVVMIVVPTHALLDQWHVSLVEDFGVKESDISVFSGLEKSEKVSKVNILLLNTARSLAKKIADENDTMLIVDECHRAGSPQNARALEGNHKFTLGLSATPERQYDDGFERYLIPGLGGNIAQYDYVDAMADGVISPFNLVNVQVQLTAGESDRYEKLSKSIAREYSRNESEPGSGQPSEQLESLLQRRAAISANASARIPVTAAIAFNHRGERTIIFHERIAAAEDILKILSQRGFSVALYHSQMFGPLRRDNLRMFRTGMIDTLVTCRALDEGLNVPEATVAIIAASTASRRQRIQRLGRVLRPAPGKSAATVYTLFATEPERERLILESGELSGTASISWREGRLGSADPSG